MTATTRPKAPAGETAAEWAQRVRRDHGPLPEAALALARRAMREAAEQRQTG